eukprot:8226944-Alexandrium_andersonii.AAC.1
MDETAAPAGLQGETSLPRARSQRTSVTLLVADLGTDGCCLERGDPGARRPHRRLERRSLRVPRC